MTILSETHRGVQYDVLSVRQSERDDFVVTMRITRRPSFLVMMVFRNPEVRSEVRTFVRCFDDVFFRDEETALAPRLEDAICERAVWLHRRLEVPKAVRG